MPSAPYLDLISDEASAEVGVLLKQHITYKIPVSYSGILYKCSAKKLNVRAGQVRLIQLETSILTAEAALYRTRHEKAIDNQIETSDRYSL